MGPTYTLFQELKELRKMKKLSIERMAALCNLSSRYYSDVEKGRHVLGLDKAVIIAKKFNISLDALKDTVSSTSDD